MTPHFSRRRFLTGATALFGIAALNTHAVFAEMIGHLRLSDAQWRARLSPAAYDVLRHAGTEEPFSSPLLDEHRKGTFACAGCHLALFSSSTKFDSHTGWPSFFRALPGRVTEHADTTLAEARTEVRCARCDGHLGHLFQDGPQPTGLRYCMNGVALEFHRA